MTNVTYTMTIRTFEDGSQVITFLGSDGTSAASVYPNGSPDLYTVLFHGERPSAVEGVTLHDGIGIAASTLARRAKN